MQYHCLPVVRIEVRDKENDEVIKFHEWAHSQKMYPIRGCGYYAPNEMVAFYMPEDAKRIQAWLEEHGATNLEDDDA